MWIKFFVILKKNDHFAVFKTEDLRDYEKFKGIIISFREFYGLEKYDLKQIDQYLWQLGKEYFSINKKRKIK